MLFEPARVEVRKGEQIRFVLYNDGIENHEFVLATVAENRKHAALMKRFPKMEHHDPSAVRVSPFNQDEILWKFTKVGEFEFACLITGHYEAGMHGKIIVKWKQIRSRISRARSATRSTPRTRTATTREPSS